MSNSAAGDRDNFSGDITITAGETMVKGGVYTHGSCVVVARQAITSGDDGLVAVSGPVVANKLSTAVVTKLLKVYGDTGGNNNLTVVGPEEGLCGIALEAAGNGTTEVLILLSNPLVTLT